MAAFHLDVMMIPLIENSTVFISNKFKNGRPRLHVKQPSRSQPGIRPAYSYSILFSIVPYKALRNIKHSI